MRIIRYISALLMAMTASSCAVMDFENDMMASPPPANDMNPNHFIAGMVFDSEDNRLEHIKVTLDWNNGLDKLTKYTASDGSFTAELPKYDNIEGISITITLDDVDGEANGGQFNSMTDNIVLNSESGPTGILVYRLTRATPSENIPRP